MEAAAAKRLCPRYSGLPPKSYAANIEQDGKLYDFAALARTDAPGLLIAYVKKSSEDVGDLTVGYLLDHFPLEDGGVATICQDDAC